MSAFPQTVANSRYSEQAPFAIGPPLFHLQAGESVAVEVSAWVKKKKFKGVQRVVGTLKF